MSGDDHYGRSGDKAAPDFGRLRNAGARPDQPPRVEAAKPTSGGGGTRVPIPSIQGPVARALLDGADRDDLEQPLVFDDSTNSVELRTAEERGLVALACLLLDNTRRWGGSTAPRVGLMSLLDRLLPELSAREMMTIEVEAYRIVQWLGQSLRPALLEADQLQTKEGGPVIEYDPSAAHISLVRRALRESFDLEMTYYTGARGELNTRRVTPLRIDAEKYLHGYCHTRRDNRVFRLSRIASLEPVGGRAVAGRPAKQPSASRDEPASGVTQGVLFGDE